MAAACKPLIEEDAVLTPRGIRHPHNHAKTTALAWAKNATQTKCLPCTMRSLLPTLLQANHARKDQKGQSRDALEEPARGMQKRHEARAWCIRHKTKHRSSTQNVCGSCPAMACDGFRHGGWQWCSPASVEVDETQWARVGRSYLSCV